jgi:hypothetical protein
MGWRDREIERWRDEMEKVSQKIAQYYIKFKNKIDGKNIL